MRSSIIVTRRIHPHALARLETVGDLRIWEGNTPIPGEVLTDWMTQATACLCMLNDTIDGRLLQSAKSLKIVANMAVGYDNIDLQSASQHGVMVTNTPDVLTEATAELTWALILACARNIVPARRQLLQGRWTTWSPDGFLGTELSGKTLGIVGLGRIGRSVARRAGAFNMSVITIDRTKNTPRTGPIEPESIRHLSLSDFLQQSDVISLHVPLTPLTRQMVSRTWFDSMKPTAILVNTARGGIIDEPALQDALDAGQIAGAALDVFHHEPVDNHHPLAAHPRVLATPHIGSATHETRRAMALKAADNIVHALSGDTPPNLLNPDAITPR